MKDTLIDPVAEVLLDFQSVMAQFLELQTSVIDAVVSRNRDVRGAALPVAQQPVPVEPVARVSLPAPAAEDPSAQVPETQAVVPAKTVEPPIVRAEIPVDEASQS